MLRKISEIDNHNCNDPEHDPPNKINLEPGLYENICPTCGFRKQFIIHPKPQLLCEERCY
jgi:hypothetical protein